MRSAIGRSLSSLFGTVILAFMLSSSQTVFSQATKGGETLQGRVADSAGAALSGASVALSNLSTGLERVAIADASGNFAFRVISEGRYRLTASAVGFAPVSREVANDTSEKVDFSLEPAALAERVTVVSGSRQEELRESLNTKVDVIGRARIRDTGNESVAEVLQELPGVVTRRGTQGAGAAGEQIQGIDSRQVLVLFDGQPIIGARGIKRGVLKLDQQSVNTLERIKVVKGASSALYGSDAIGGVINRISRDPAAPIETSLTASSGSQGRADFRHDVGFGGDKLSVFLSGARHKQNPFFGSAVSPKAGLNVRVTDYWRIRASYGRGFRAPDLGQLFYRFLNSTNLYQVIGNPNLRPEYANSHQVGSEFTSLNHRARFSVNVFRNGIEDLIDSVSLGFVATPQQLHAIAQREGIDLTAFRPALGRLLFLYENIAEAVTQGVEFDGDVLLARGFSLGGAYTHLIARDTAAHVPLLNRHKHQGSVRLAWESNARLGLRANVRGAFYSKWINTLRTVTANAQTGQVTTTPDVIPPGFSLWDFYAAKRVYRGLELFGAVDNFHG